MGRIHRKTVQTGLRIFVDQLKALRELRKQKYRDGVSTAYLMREALDRYLDQELGDEKQKKP